MEMEIQLTLQSLLVPLAWSFIAREIGDRTSKHHLLLIFLLWLSCYLWISGLPTIPPGDALSWLGFLGLAYLCNYYLLSHYSINYTIVSMIIAVGGMLLLALPVISHFPETGLFVELCLFAALGSLLLLRLRTFRPVTPALSLGISSAGLALVSILGGNLVVGQVAASIASILGAFVFFEWSKSVEKNTLSLDVIVLFALFNFWLLIIASIYADLDAVPVVLLALALLVGLSLKWRYASALSLLFVVGSLCWLLVFGDSSSYY